MATTQECCKQYLLNKSWKQHPTKQHLYGHLPPIMKNIQVRWTRHVEHCWRSRDELISYVFLWTPSHGWAKVGWPTRTYIQQLCADTGCSLENLPEAMNDREGWWEIVQNLLGFCYWLKKLKLVNALKNKLVVWIFKTKLVDFYRSGFLDYCLQLYCYISIGWNVVTITIKMKTKTLNDKKNELLRLDGCIFSLLMFWKWELFIHWEMK